MTASGGSSQLFDLEWRVPSPAATGLVKSASPLPPALVTLRDAVITSWPSGTPPPKTGPFLQYIVALHALGGHSFREEMAQCFHALAYLYDGPLADENKDSEGYRIAAARAASLALQFSTSAVPWNADLVRVLELQCRAQKQQQPLAIAHLYERESGRLADPIARAFAQTGEAHWRAHALTQSAPPVITSAMQQSSTVPHIQAQHQLRARHYAAALLPLEQALATLRAMDQVKSVPSLKAMYQVLQKRVQSLQAEHDVVERECQAYEAAIGTYVFGSAQTPPLVSLAAAAAAAAEGEVDNDISDEERYSLDKTLRTQWDSFSVSFAAVLPQATKVAAPPRDLNHIMARVLGFPTTHALAQSAQKSKKRLGSARDWLPALLAALSQRILLLEQGLEGGGVERERYLKEMREKRDALLI